MTAREKITLAWRPKDAGQPEQNQDEYVECKEAVPSCETEGRETPSVHAKRLIRDRLRNWGRWVDWCDRRDFRGRGASCMTGLICDRMRRAALGDVWSGANLPPDIDEKDAELIERAWRVLQPKHKKLILWTYVFNWRPDFICKRLGIKRHPESIFLLKQVRAEQELEKKVVNGRIPAYHPKQINPGPAVSK